MFYCPVQALRLSARCDCGKVFRIEDASPPGGALPLDSNRVNSTADTAKICKLQGITWSVGRVMAIRVDALQEPLRKLLKLVKRLPKDPSMDDVHQLRTEARRLEAIAAVLTVPEEPETHRFLRQLLKEITPIRRAAGKVRDLDVMIASALTLAGEGEQESQARLIGQLDAMRVEAARELHETVVDHRRDARRGLKRCLRWIEENFQGEQLRESSGHADNGPPEADAGVVNLARELARWPRPGPANIHRFRIRVKELRNILQLLDDRDAKFVAALGHVKDQIGEWHDWCEFARVAGEVLDPNADAAMLKEVRDTTRKKLKPAIDAAQAMRSRYLGTVVKAGPRKLLQSRTLKPEME